MELAVILILLLLLRLVSCVGLLRLLPQMPLPLLLLLLAVVVVDRLPAVNFVLPPAMPAVVASPVLADYLPTHQTALQELPLIF